MDKGRIAALAARGGRIKTNSAEYLWICRGGVRPPLIADKPVVTDPNVHPDNLQAPLRRANSAAPISGRTCR